MRSLLFALVVLASSVSMAADVGPGLQGTSVNIKAPSESGSGGSQGSGTVVLQKIGGQDTAFILTAAHVIDGLRKVTTVIDEEGKEKKVISYRDAQIVQEVSNSDQSRTVGDTRLDAKVIAADYARDIALLRVRATGSLKSTATFYLDGKVPCVGTEIYHCGSPGGQDMGGHASLTSGIVSRTGVRKSHFGGAEHGIYDQADCSGMGGSSGGMVCLRSNGQWIGMITLGIRGGDSFHWFVPVRNVKAWAKEAKCEWLLRPNDDITGDIADGVKLEISPPGSQSGSSKDNRTERMPASRGGRVVQQIW